MLCVQCKGRFKENILRKHAHDFPLHVVKSKQIIIKKLNATVVTIKLPAEDNFRVY